MASDVVFVMGCLVATVLFLVNGILSAEDSTEALALAVLLACTLFLFVAWVV